MVTDQDYWDEANNQIELLHNKLAEREAEIAKLREVLETVEANTPDPYCAITRAVDAQVRKALSTPQSSSYLEQWEKEKYGEPVCEAIDKQGASTRWWWTDEGLALPKGSKLYARKD
jgi:hypothetical protein